MGTNESNVKGATYKYELGTLDVGNKAWYEIKHVDWQENFIDLTPEMIMCYMTMGPEEGRPIFLLHGGGDCRVSWSNIAPIFAEQGHRVFVPEHRGHGRSSAPEVECGYYVIEDYAADVIALMDKLNIEKADFIGHSCGSLASQILAIYYPERVRTITLIATGPYVTDFQGYRITEVDDDFCRGWGACELDDPEFCEGIYNYVKQVPLRRWQLMAHGIEKFDTRDKLHLITCPVLLLWGSKDGIFSAADQELMLKGLSNTSYTFVKINGASHSPFWDSKENINLVTNQVKFHLENN